MDYDLAAVLRAEGLTVEGEPGWERRSNGGAWAPVGFMVHHTAMGPQVSDRGVDKVLRDGRSDLKGPLCHFRLKRNGVVRIVAGGGGANHAGVGSGAVLQRIKKGQGPGKPSGDDTNGNRYFWGVECDNDGVGEGWSRPQMEALERLLTAICRAERWPASRVIAHREWTTRKVDPRGINMDSLRTVVAHRLAGPGHAQTGTTAGGTAARGEATWEVAAVNSLPTLGIGAGTAEKPNGYVKRLQGLLQAEGSKVQMTGVFDRATANAVVASQKRHKITADGVVGRGTWTKLLGL